ncbi:MAG: FAD assembly factor SdhE [Gammaproteobacteria bacterium]
MDQAAPGAVRWQCRRGMKELDLLLVRWLERRWPGAEPAVRDCFAQLLDQPDPLLADWLLHGTRPVHPGLAALVDDILLRHD